MREQECEQDETGNCNVNITLLCNQFLRRFSTYQQLLLLDIVCTLQLKHINYYRLLFNRLISSRLNISEIKN